MDNVQQPTSIFSLQNSLDISADTQNVAINGNEVKVSSSFQKENSLFAENNLNINQMFNFSSVKSDENKQNNFLANVLTGMANDSINEEKVKQTLLSEIEKNLNIGRENQIQQTLNNEHQHLNHFKLNM